jgi:hypothetical protein
VKQQQSGAVMNNQKKYTDFFERPGTIKALWVLLFAVCALTLVPDFFIHRHPHFAYDDKFGFFALLGFVACALLILLAKGIGFVLKKKEDYYDD